MSESPNISIPAIQAFNEMFNDDVNEVEEVIRPPLMRDLNKAEIRSILRNTIDGEPSDHTDENLVVQKTTQSSIEGHREWFEPVDDNQYGGLHEKYRNRTKEYYLNCVFEKRIQRYYSNFFENLDNDESLSFHPNYRDRVTEVRNEFQIKKYNDEENRKYFDRTNPDTRKCTPLGDFVCMCDEDVCYHSINPYKCREQRLLFTSNVSEWSLDHVIERNGPGGQDPNFIYGAMKSAIKESMENNDKIINVDYFYRLLCTMKPMGNMNLVHEDCHPESHPGRHVDPDQIFVI